MVAREDRTRDSRDRGDGQLPRAVWGPAGGVVVPRGHCAVTQQGQGSSVPRLLPAVRSHQFMKSTWAGNELQPSPTTNLTHHGPSLNRVP